MTIAFWGFSDATSAFVPSFSGRTMFPIIPQHVVSALKTSSGSSEASLSSSPRTPKSPRSSATPPSPASSPLISAKFPLRIGSPPLSLRATSTPHMTVDPPANVGVIAGEDIPLHTVSREFRLSPDKLSDNSFEQICVRMSSSGHLEGSGAADQPLSLSMVIPAMRLADDCHSVNVQVQRGSSAGHLRVRAVRPVSRGQEFMLWFADDLLADLRLPFLAPHNIQGEKTYICHLCGRPFEFPNPLKLHLALDCGRQSRDELWTRLARSHTSAFKPYWNSLSDSSLSISSSSSNGDQLSDTSANSVHIAPYSLMPGVGVGAGAAHRLFGAPLSSPVSVLPCATDSRWTAHPHHPHPHTGRAPLTGPTISSYHQHASDMETLVSNLGRSKQGHLCIYCGKVYSRKYGLKIHIRTHTGFKPLKCKFCLRPFGDPSNLNKHVRLHAEGDTPYKCELCGKVLVRRRDLERHIKSRHQDGVDWDENDTNEDIDVDVDDDTLEETEEIANNRPTRHCNVNALSKRSPSDIVIPTV